MLSCRDHVAVRGDTVEVVVAKEAVNVNDAENDVLRYLASLILSAPLCPV